MTPNFLKNHFIGERKEESNRFAVKFVPRTHVIGDLELEWECFGLGARNNFPLGTWKPNDLRCFPRAPTYHEHERHGAQRQCNCEV